MISQSELEMLEQAYKASTRGIWRRGRKELPNIGETIAWLGRMADYHQEQPNLEMVCAMVDGSEPPDILENIEDYYCPAITGNGPTSEANALFLELAHNFMPQLLACVRDLMTLRAEVNAEMSGEA